MLNGGFTGLFWAGHRGPLPPWTAQLHEIGENLFELPNGARLRFEQVNGATHFTHRKADLMLDLIHRKVATKLLWYFDPDITTLCSWRFFGEWAKFGVALCSDITNGSMPARHPLRCMWVEAAMRAGWGEPVAPQIRYYNAGFIGLDVAYAAFLERWRGATTLAVQQGADLSVFMPGTREEPFNAADQDALNLACMYATEPLSTIGPEGMGFVNGGFTMYHCVGAPKPWRKQFILSALRGMPPTNGDKHFLACVEGPLRPYRSNTLKAMRLRSTVGAVIGRFYRRT